MSSLDLHPEELLDKAARGLATPGEQARLDEHLAACATCRFEQRTRADFATVSGHTGDVEDLVARALSGAATAAPPVSPMLGRRRRVGPLLVAAAALAGMASFAAVAKYTGLLPKLLAGDAAPPLEPPRAPRRLATAPQPRSPEVAPPDDAPAPPVEPLPVATPPVEPPVAPRSTRRPAPAVEPAAVESPRAREPDPEPEPDALALFARARDARVRGDTSSALRDLRAVVARFPDAPEAALAHAELGRLLLDRGEAASALEAFDAYLASSHHLLAEDVRGARALALQALGRADEERAAWEAVLRDDPHGVYAPRARARLEALSR